MRELAVQAATDTNTIEDREEIQKEIDQLTTEIQRIAADTQFNTQALLDGTYDGKVFHIGSNEGQNVGLSIQDMGVDKLGVFGGGVPASGTAQIGAGDNPVTVTITGGTDAAYNDIEIKFESGAAAQVEWGGDGGEPNKTLTITLKKNGGEYTAGDIQKLINEPEGNAPEGIENTAFKVFFSGKLEVPEDLSGTIVVTGGVSPPPKPPR